MPTTDDKTRRLLINAPRMARVLQRVAPFLAELPTEMQNARLISIREDVVGALKDATPAHYGIKAPPLEVPNVVARDLARALCPEAFDALSKWDEFMRNNYKQADMPDLWDAMVAARGAA